MNKNKIERETIIIFNEAEEFASVWSISTKVIKMLQRLGFQGDSRGTRDSKWFKVPKNEVIIRKKRQRKAGVMSQEQRAISLKRMMDGKKAKQTA